jgi:hypothetical protein
MLVFSKLRTIGEIRESNLPNVALMLCATEVAVLLGGLLLEVSLGHRFILVSRISALSWLLFGVASIIVSIAGFARGRKNSSISVLALCITIFILCAFRFALV